jgi:hypothetical protein
MVGSWGLEPQTSTVSIRFLPLRMELHRAEHAFWCKEPSVTTQSASQFLALFNERAGNSQGGTIGARVAEEKSTRFSSSALLRATFSLTIRLLLEEWALPIAESDEGRMPLRFSLDSYAAKVLVTEPALFADLRLCCYRTP